MLLEENHITSLEEIEVSISSLFLQQQNKLHQCIQAYIEDEATAEDLSQELFVRLWARREELFHVEDLSSYLFRMTHHLCIDYMRKRRLERKVLQGVKEKQPACSNMTEELIYQKEIEELLQQAIQKLPPQCRKVYLLCKVEGLPLDKVAAILKVSTQTVKNQMRSANLQIRNYVNKRTGLERKRKYRYNYNKARKNVFETMRVLKAA